jgi:ADP-ribose pyrophosphatase
MAKRASGKHSVKILSSVKSYAGPLFDVYTDTIEENGRKITRDVVRHNGSVVILAVDDRKSTRDPLVVIERQYRHAAGDFLLEVPAGKLEAGETPLAGAKRELLEETGFRAKRWRKMVRYYASPGFVGEWLQIFIAEGLSAGTAQPEYDEQLEIRMIPLSQLMTMIDGGKIHDGKTIISIMLYDRWRKANARTPKTVKS